MAELYRFVRTDLNAHSIDDVYEKVGYTEDDVRRLVIEARARHGGKLYDHNSRELLAPFRHLLTGGKTNG